MIKIISKTLSLTSRILFNVSRPRRSPEIPTQKSFIRPFSINFLNDNKGARIYPKQVGRGPGSGKGKFAARGMKGHKSRTGGGVNVRFQGGQTPISRRLPKYGRVKRKFQRQILDYVNIQSIDYYVKRGILNPKQPITIKKLNDCGLVKKVIYGVKVLGKGLQNINYPLHLEVSDASQNVIKHLNSTGGSVKLIFRTKLKLNQHINPQKYPLPLADPLPPTWRVRKLDRIAKKRGLDIIYRKPAWKKQQQNQESTKEESTNKFQYPVSRQPNPNKIHVRRPKIYRRISYNLS